MSNRQAVGFQRELSSIRTSERQMRHDRSGHLSTRDEAMLQARIDRLNDRLQIAS